MNKIQNSIILIAIAWLYMPISTAKPTIFGHFNQSLTSIKPASNVNVPGLIYFNKIAYQQSVNYKNSDGDTLFDNNKFDSYGVISQHSFMYTYKNTIENLANARVHTNITIPLSKIKIRGQTTNDFSGIGDIIINPLILSWHNYKNWQYMLSTAVVLPNADYKNGLGKNFWSYRIAGGFTYYFDDNKDLAFSNLLRIEGNTKQKHTNITAGSELSYEWSLSYKLDSSFEIGVVGSHLYQIEDDKGTNNITYAKDSIHNIGAQIIYYDYVNKYNLGLAVHRDYLAKGRPQFWNIMTNFSYKF